MCHFIENKKIFHPLIFVPYNLIVWGMREEEIKIKVSKHTHTHTHQHQQRSDNVLQGWLYQTLVWTHPSGCLKDIFPGEDPKGEVSQNWQMGFPCPDQPNGAFRQFAYSLSVTQVCIKDFTEAKRSLTEDRALWLIPACISLCMLISGILLRGWHFFFLFWVIVCSSSV